MYFSYNQFVIFDESVALPGHPWTQEDFEKGFVYASGNVAVGTILEFGDAEIDIYESACLSMTHYERVIEAPFEVLSGKVVVAGPEEFDHTRVVKISNGQYRLTAAQTVRAQDREQIDLFFEALSEPLSGASIVVADSSK
jgi:hypothetical protein